jgi:hypothetical protein
MAQTFVKMEVFKGARGILTKMNPKRRSNLAE